MGTEYSFSFNSTREHYRADAAVVWCFDDRLTPLYENFCKAQNFQYVDLIKIAGGAKALASDSDLNAKVFILDQIRKSIALHHAKKIILMVHSDCGAYGGLSKFDNNSKEESVFLETELSRAKEYVKAEIAGIQVEGFLADFSGLKSA